MREAEWWLLSPWLFGGLRGGLLAVLRQHYTTVTTKHTTAIRISLYIKFRDMIDIYTLIVVLFTLNSPSSTAASSITIDGRGLTKSHRKLHTDPENSKKADNKKSYPIIIRKSIQTKETKTGPSVLCPRHAQRLS